MYSDSSMQNVPSPLPTPASTPDDTPGKETPSSWLLELLRTSWVSLTLITVVILLFTYNVGQAHWVPSSDPFNICVLLGALCGYLLASTRWNGWLAALYSLALSLAVISQVIGNILPPLAVSLSMYPTDTLWVMNIRILALAERVNGWLAAIFSGGQVNDTNLFIFLIGFIAWNASAWLLWCIVRRRNAPQGLLPYGLLMGINVYLSDQGLEVFLFFIGAAVLLVSRTTFTAHYADWERRRVDYSAELGFEWAVSAAAVAIMVVLLAGLATLMLAPRGWQRIGDAYRDITKNTEKTAERLFAGVTPPKSRASATQAQAPELNLIGGPLPRGEDTVMYVSISDPPPPPPLPKPQAVDFGVIVLRHYWRQSIYNTYTGVGWEAAPLQQQPLPGAQGEHGAALGPGQYELKQKYEIVALHSRELFSTSQPVSASSANPDAASPANPAAGNTNLVYALPDGSSLVQGSVSMYAVTSWAANPTISQMQDATGGYPPEIAQTYLQLTDWLPHRVSELAKRIAAPGKTAYEKAMRIQDYLRLTYPYRIDVPPPPAGKDAVDYFLFEAPGGFCTYYASAMAVMLRVEGIPARVVTGYAMGEYDYSRDAYRVPVSASHAWVEVYFPGLGWVEFEPTSALSTFTRPAGELSQVPTPPAAATQQASQTGNAAVVLAGLVLLAAAALALMILSARGRLAPDAALPPTSRQALVLYHQVRWALSWAGLHAPPSHTPDEFMAACAVPLQECPGLWQALQQATAIYSAAVFSPRPPGPEVTYRARRAWQRALPAWLLLTLQNLVRGKRKN